MVSQIGLPVCGHSLGQNYQDTGADFGLAPILPYLDYGTYPDNTPALIPAVRTTDAILNEENFRVYGARKMWCM